MYMQIVLACEKPFGRRSFPLPIQTYIATLLAVDYFSVTSLLTLKSLLNATSHLTTLREMIRIFKGSFYSIVGKVKLEHLPDTYRQPVHETVTAKQQAVRFIT